MPEQGVFAFARQTPVRHRWWLHILLLLLTLLTTTVVGAGMAASFEEGTPIDFDRDLHGYVRMWDDPWFLLDGLPFSLTLLGILLAHEFGHFWTARYYGIHATLPFFLPAPTLIGTLGAFIRIRSMIPTKRILFDIGIAGPLAGFAALVLPLVAGVSLSKVVPGISARSELEFGTPLILQLFQWLQFPGAAAGDIYLHPVARAAWVGLLATALNLLPIGQLDGGHIVYAFLGERTKYLSALVIAVVVALGAFVAWSWLVWALLLLLFGLRHPSIVDPFPLGRTRAWLACSAAIIFILSFTPSPVRFHAL
jgi:membrane-associated protease RseP (regulator of RpoE activity)